MTEIRGCMLTKFIRSNSCMPQADKLEKLTDFMMRPYRVLLGNEIKLNSDYSKLEECTLSKTARIGYVFLFLIFIPVTGLMTLVGVVIIPLSKTYYKTNALFLEKLYHLVEKEKKNPETSKKIPPIDPETPKKTPPIDPETSKKTPPINAVMDFFDKHGDTIKRKFTSSGEPLFFLKNVARNGTQRKVKYVHSLKRPNLLVRKPLCEKGLEIPLLRHFAQNFHKGVIQPIQILEVPKKLGKKVYSIEENYPFTLVNFFSPERTIKMGQKIKMISDLLEGLSAIHLYTPPAPLLKTDHGDIKPSNILLKQSENEEIEVVITDFDLSGRKEELVGTAGFFSPEAISRRNCSALEDNYTISQQRIRNINFNKDKAQGKDVWALGIVLAGILIGEKFEYLGFEAPSLKCMQKLLAIGTKKDAKTNVQLKELNDSGIVNLMQEDIDKEIEDYKEKLLPDGISKESWSQIWDVIAKMLQIDPVRRANIHQTKKMFSEISGDKP